MTINTLLLAYPWSQVLWSGHSYFHPSCYQLLPWEEHQWPKAAEDIPEVNNVPSMTEWPGMRCLLTTRQCCLSSQGNTLFEWQCYMCCTVICSSWCLWLFTVMIGVDAHAWSLHQWFLHNIHLALYSLWKIKKAVWDCGLYIQVNGWDRTQVFSNQERLLHRSGHVRSSKTRCRKGNPPADGSQAPRPTAWKDTFVSFERFVDIVVSTLASKHRPFTRIPYCTAHRHRLYPTRLSLPQRLAEAQMSCVWECATVLVSTWRTCSTWGPTSLWSLNRCLSNPAKGDIAEDSLWTSRNHQMFTASHFLSLVARCQTTTWEPHSVQNAARQRRQPD